MRPADIIRPLLLAALALLSGCAAQQAEWSPGGQPTPKAQLWTSDGYPTFVHTCYSTDGEAIVIRKGKLDGAGEFPANFQATAQRRIPCSARDLYVFNLTIAALDTKTHEEEARQRKDIVCGPFFTVIVDGVKVAEGWTPELDHVRLNMCEFILQKEFEREAK
jgi:hypothetical protein